MARENGKVSPVPSRDAHESGKKRSRPVGERAASRAEKRKARSLKSRVELALEEAERSSMVYDLPSRRRAAGWMMRLATGCDKDLRSNVFRKEHGNRSYEEITAAFDERYSETMSTVSDKTLVDVIWKELEEGNRSKIGPKSMYRGFYEDGPVKLQAVMSDKPIPSKLDRKAFARALDRLVAEVPSQSIRLYDVETVVNTLRVPGEEHDPEAPGLDGTTNSGPPHFKSGWKAHPGMEPKRHAEALAVQKYVCEKAKRLFAEMSSGETSELWAMVGQRTVNRGLNPLKDEKTKRLVLALEKAEAVLWKMFTPQLQQYYRGFKAPGGVQVHVAWCDIPAVDQNMQLMLDVAAQGRRTVLSGDVSAFDASVVPKLWDDMAKATSSWFYKAQKFFYHLNRSDIYGVKVLSPLGVTGPVASSIKSGSGGTNYVDSQYNKLALYYGEEMGFYKLINYAVQGDDFTVDAEGLSAEAISEAYSALGLTVHPDKQAFVEGALMFLQRLHVRGMIGGMASVYRTLASTLVYEKLMMKSQEWNPYMEAIQCISKLENAGFHPAFETLVGFVRDGDKYQLGANMRPAKVIQLAGGKAGDLLAAQSKFTLNAMTLDQTASGFDRAVTNGVLRGESLPQIGSRERFLRVYGEERINKAIAVSA